MYKARQVCIQYITISDQEQSPRLTAGVRELSMSSVNKREL